MAFPACSHIVFCQVLFQYPYTFFFYLLTVPPFKIDITQNYLLDTLYAGTPLTLTCNITLDDLVDIPVIVTNQWTRNMMNIIEPTITETIVQTDTNHYTATLDFYPVYDNGEYKCTVLVTANTDDNYTASITNDASTDVVVEGPYIIQLCNNALIMNRSKQQSISYLLILN